MPYSTMRTHTGNVRACMCAHTHEEISPVAVLLQDCLLTSPHSVHVLFHYSAANQKGINKEMLNVSLSGQVRKSPVLAQDKAVTLQLYNDRQQQLTMKVTWKHKKVTVFQFTGVTPTGLKNILSNEF